MTTPSDRDETGTFERLAPRHLRAIDDSLRELQQQLVDVVQQRDEHEEEQVEARHKRNQIVHGVVKSGGTFHVNLTASVGAGKSIAGMRHVLEKGEVEYVLLVGGLNTAIARTEQEDDHFNIDVGMWLKGLDEYEVQAVKRVTEHLRTFIAAARQQNTEERVTQLLKAIAPPDPLADVQVKVAEATLSLRKDFLEEILVLTSADVHANAGFPRGNASQTVHRWRKPGRIFAINHGGRDLYPAFQFGSDGRPLPIIAEVLAILKRDPERSDWDNALWFAGDSGWLDGKRPIDCLQSDPEGVKRAAEQEVLVDEY